MILIIASKRDVHARHVTATLEKSGHEALIIDSGEFGNGAVASYDLNNHAELVTPNGQRVNLNEVKSIWNRRPRLANIAADINDPGMRTFCRQEWINLLDGMFINTTAAVVNPLWSEYAAVKPRQLHVARRVGLRVPDTLITSDSISATHFIAKHNSRIIHKAMTAPKDRLLDTRTWSEADRQVLGNLPVAPTIFQELIDGPSDVRVTMVGKSLFAARISTSLGRAGVDSRMDMDTPYEAFDLPRIVHDQLLAFMGEMGLVYGTIDLKITDDGEYVFFEVNPQGQFLYVEILTGMPITQAMASLLAA